ncbi:MAG: hypothetical protein ACXWFY_08085, partial [Chthoniobacterales bacterium]
MNTPTPRLRLPDRRYFFLGLAAAAAFLLPLRCAEAQDAIALGLTTQQRPQPAKQQAPAQQQKRNSNGDLLPQAADVGRTDITAPATRTSKWQWADLLRAGLGLNPFSDDLEAATFAARRANSTTSISPQPMPVDPEYDWNSATSGAYSNPANWTPNGVPLTTSDSGVVPVQAGSATYTITMDANPNIISFNIQDTKATLDLNGNTMTTNSGITNSGTISSGANGSTLAGATVTNNATIQSTGGFSLFLNSPVSNSSTGHIDVGGTGSTIIQNGV